MVKILIVEDEAVIRNGLVKHIPWDKLEVEDIKTSENAERAIEDCKVFTPDIIISDICMPGMNGIEFCKKIRKSLPETQIIFISGYSEKEYLKEAINLGAVSYIEKPISIEELTDAIETATNKVKRSNRQNINVLHSLLRYKTIGENEAINALNLYERGKELKAAKAFCLGILISKDRSIDIFDAARKWREKIKEECSEKGITLIADSLVENEYALLFFGPENMGDDLDEVLALVRGMSSDPTLLTSFFLGIGKVVNNLEHLPETYQSAREALKRISYKGWGTHAYYHEPLWEWKEFLHAETQGKFRKLLNDKKFDEAKEFLNDLYNRLMDGNAELGFYVRNMYFILDGIIKDVASSFGLVSHDDDVSVLHDALSIKDLNDYMINSITVFEDEVKEENKTRYVIKQVIDCMYNNIDKKDLSIQFLADSVYLSATYLANLFKKNTGKTLGQQLTDIRMQRAKELLADSQYKLYQVAEMVGYDDANYFAKTFKKKIGMLPSEYRDSLKVD